METLSPPQEKARILVVEDERIVARSLGKHLQNLGYEVVDLISSGEEAIKTAGEHQPDLVLMDISLEGPIDGVAAAAAIRQQFHLPVVFLTAFSNREILDRAKVTEPFGYILKPYEDRELQVVVEMALYRHRMERRLQERERWFAATLKSIGDGVVATDDEGRITYMNPVAEQLTGWTSTDARGRSIEEIMELIDSGSGETIVAPLWKAMAERRNVPLDSRAVLVARNGVERAIDDCASPITDAQGVSLGGVMVFRDVTQHKEAEKAISKLAAIVSSSDDAIIGRTMEGIIFSWNPGAAKLFGYTAEEAIGQPATLNLPPDRSEESRWITHQVNEGVQVPAFETVRRRKDGKDIEVMLSISPIRDAEGAVIGSAFIGHDITKTKRLEEQYRQAQKMEAVGRLAGGIAHDFNNLLTVINGYSDILLATLHEHDKSREIIEQISRAGERAAALTQQLLAYSRKQMLQPRVLDLNELVSGIDKLLARLIGADIELVTTPFRKPCQVRADPTQIQQVLLNLAVNSRDAMPGGGRLVLETSHVELDETYAEEFAEVRPGPYVLLSVSDTGTGMDRETIARIFEPFFTTKEQGRGTGLGLATVYGVIKQSGGHIRVYSEPGHDTIFKIYLPRLIGTDEEPVARASAGEIKTGTETILLVEDEDAVRSLALLILQRAGYHVLTATHGTEALSLCARHGGPLDLLVTDVVMPKMGGRQLAEAMQQLYPGMGVLYVSGYTEDELVYQGVLMSRMDFLQKPFSRTALTYKVREILDRRRSGSV